MGAQLQNRARRRTRAHRPMAEINVTPFVDVMLVLLVVFMVAAPLLTVGVPVDLPKAQASALNESDNSPVEITISKKGKIHIGKTEVTLERMAAMLEAMAAANPDRRVYVRGDQTLAYGTVMKIMAAINAAGFNKVALISDPAGGS